MMLMMLLVSGSQSFLACHRMWVGSPSVHPLYQWNVSWFRTGAWYWILTKLRPLWLVYPGLSTIYTRGDLVLFLFALVPTLIFLAGSLTAGSPSKTVCVCSLTYLSKIFLRLVKRVLLDTSVLLRCYYAFVITILEYCSPVWRSAAECHLQLRERQVYSVARLCPDQTFLSLCHRRHVAALCML